MRKLNIILAVALMAGTYSLDGNAVHGKKRDREEGHDVVPDSPLGMGTHLCRLDREFMASKKNGKWKKMPPVATLRTAFLPCNELVPNWKGNESWAVVQILPEDAYYAPLHRPIAIAHEDAIAIAKFRPLRAVQVGFHVFAKWVGPHDAGAPKLWEAEIVAFNIANKTATIRWVFTDEEHPAQIELPFAQLYHVPRE